MDAGEGTEVSLKTRVCAVPLEGRVFIVVMVQLSEPCLIVSGGETRRLLPVLDLEVDGVTLRERRAWLRLSSIFC